MNTYESVVGSFYKIIALEILKLKKVVSIYTTSGIDYLYMLYRVTI